MKKKLLHVLSCAVLSCGSIVAQKGLIISEFLTNPSGNDSPFEYVELIATQNINFATTPYSVVFTDNGTATSNGWKAGGLVSYGFTVTSGSVVAGQVVYIGGSSMAPLSNGGVALKTKNTGTNGGDSFGSSNSAGVLGQGGSNADGIAVFAVKAADIISSTVPVDAIFFGSAVGSAYKSSSSGYQLPINDKYNGGKVSTGIFLAPDPSSDQLVKATAGVFNTTSQTFTTVRAWATTTTPSYNTSSVSVSGGPINVAPTIAFLPNASKLVDETSGKISCVRNNATDPVIVSGLDFNVTDEDLASLTFQMTSSQTSVVANTSFTVIGTGNARKLKINPSAAGYSTIIFKVIDNGTLSAQITFSLAVSNSLTTSTVADYYHTGMSDGSTAVPIDANYMFVGDDETNQIRLYNRNVSGLPLYQFDLTPYLALSGTEVDIEGSFVSPTNPNRIYWIGSMSNNKNAEARPDRNRIFATDIVGSGATATLTFVGYYSNLRSKICAWGDSYGLALTSKAAVGVDPKTISGFNIEGFEMGPDGTTAYIAFRAPYVSSTQTKALICPLANFEAWFNNGTPSTNPTFAAPIQLNLNSRGIRSLGKNAANQYIIVAGGYDDTQTFQLYSWNGQAASAPGLLTADLTGLRPEGIVEVPASLSGTFQLQLISDLGSTIWYNDAIQNKDLIERNYMKFTSSIINVSGSVYKTDETNSIEESQIKSAVIVFPNPVTNSVSINFGVALPSSGSYLIYSANGALVKEINASSNGNIVNLDLTDLASGNYVISVKGLNQSVSVIKQ